MRLTRRVTSVTVSALPVNSYANRTRSPDYSPVAGRRGPWDFLWPRTPVAKKEKAPERGLNFRAKNYASL
jgi:hypothetical protein